MEIIGEKLYRPIVGDLAAHQISTIIAVEAFVALVYFMVRNDVVGASNTKLSLIGLLLVIMIIIF